MTSLRDEIQRRPVLLDGGLSTTLELLGHDISGDLWSARLLKDNPSAIADAHQAFFDAGAEVATTATYQATFAGFESHDIGAAETALLMRRGVRVAREVAAGIGRPAWVAASIGPYGAMLADGSEYHGQYGLTVKQLREFHRPRIDVLAGAGADVLAFETLPCAPEVEAVLAEVSGSGVDAWLSVSIDGANTRAGEALADVFAMTREVDELIAVGINCSSPSDATAAVAAAHTSGHPVVIYPNSGEGWDAVGRQWVPAGHEEAASHWPVRDWVTDGAHLIGGCCRVSPDDIANLAATLGSPP